MNGKNLREYNRIAVTIVLVALNIIVYIYCTFVNDGVYNVGCMDTRRVLLYGEYYRLITSMFLHGGAQHLIGNMIFLAALGEMLEKAIGHFRFAMLYLLSGIGGGIFSMVNVVLRENYYTSIGASGAVFGLVGALLVLVILNHGHYEGISMGRMALAVIYMVYSGINSVGVDNAAHLGGLIFGALIMAFIYAARIFSRRY